MPRFDDDETTDPPQPIKSSKQKSHRSKNKSKGSGIENEDQENRSNAFTAFFSPPTSTPLIRDTPNEMNKFIISNVNLPMNHDTDDRYEERLTSVPKEPRSATTPAS